jgi:hypothetical protein
VAKTYTLAQRLRDPAKRAKLPASKLTPKMRAQRTQNARIARDNSNPLYDPTATLTGHALASAAKQLASTEIDPQEAALDQQSGQTRTQGTALISRAGDYYRQIAQQEQTNVAKQTALGQLLQSQLAGAGQQAQQSLDAQNTAEQSREAQDASIRGVSTGSDQVAGELAALRGRASTATQTAQTQGAQTSANWANLQNALAGAMSLKGQETTSQLTNREANALDKLASQRGAIEATRGGITAKHLLDLRQQGFENVATTQGLGLKASDLAASVAKTKGDQRIAGQRIKSAAATNAANRASREKIAGANINVRQQSLAEMHRHNVAQENKPGAKAKPRAGLGSLSQAQENSAHAQIDQAHQYIQQYAGKLSKDQLAQGLTQGFLTDANGKRLPLTKIKDPLYFEAALELHHGGLTAATVKKLHQAGVHIAGRYKIRPVMPRAGGAVGATTPLS